MLSKIALGGRGGHSQPSSSSGGQTHAAPVWAEDVVAAVSGHLEAFREEVGHGAGDLYFSVGVLGGDWSVARFRQVAKDIGSYPRDKSTSLWCKAVGWHPAPGQKSFATSKFGMEAARRLAEEVIRCANYFIGAWIDAASPSGYIFEALVAGYQSPQEYSDWFDDLTLNCDASKAAMIIRGLVLQPVPL